MAHDEYNGCDYREANNVNVRIGDQPVEVNAPHRCETDDEEGRPVPVAHAPALKRLVYKDEMRDHPVMMDMNSIIGWIIMIRLGALLEYLITPHPGWPRWTAIVGRGVKA